MSRKTIQRTESPTGYITKRIVSRVTQKAIGEASEKAMRVAGYIIKAENGWVVKELSDGTIERLHLISKDNNNTELALD